MPATYIALLRGVNVGGNSLRMDLLRRLCADLAFENVQTYVQSGNLIFTAAGAPAALRKKLEAAVALHTRLPVTIVLRTCADLRRIAAQNPFLKEPGIDATCLYVTLLARPASAEALAKLRALQSATDRLSALGTEVFIHCPHGYGRTRLSNNAIEKVLALPATTRNWNTITRLCALSTTGRDH